MVQSSRAQRPIDSAMWRAMLCPPQKKRRSQPQMLQVSLPDGSRQHYWLNRNNCTLGSSAPANICVAAHELEAEHLHIKAVDHGVQLRVSKRARTPLVINNQTFSSGFVSWGTEAELGRVHLRFGKAPYKSPLSKRKIFAAFSLAALFTVLAWILAQHCTPGANAQQSSCNIAFQACHAQS